VCAISRMTCLQLVVAEGMDGYGGGLVEDGMGGR
jgi:hypothetical protein